MSAGGKTYTGASSLEWDFEILNLKILKPYLERQYSELWTNTHLDEDSSVALLVLVAQERGAEFGLFEISSSHPWVEM